MDCEEVESEKTALSSSNTSGYDSNGQRSCEEKTDNGSITKKKSFWGDSSTRQKIIFILIVYGHTSVFMCASTPFAFIANYIVARGGVKEDAALVVDIIMLTMAISSALFGRYQMIIGTKKLFVCGLLCFGICQALFGVLEFATNATTIVVCGCIIRVIQGCGQGAYLVAALTVVCQEFPDNAVTAFGIVETFAAIGYTCGPLLGSVFFSISNGILLPFLISIILLIPLLPTGLCLLKDYNAPVTDNGDVHGSDVIRKPVCALILGMATALYGTFGVMDVLLSVYFTHIGFTIIEVGYALVLLAAAYGITSSLLAFIVDIGNKSRRTVFALGWLGLAGIPFAFTPTITKPEGFVIVASFGLFAAFGLISSFGELLHLAVSDRPELKTSFALHSTLSGLWNLAYGAGTFIYPLLGASLLRVMRFAFALFSVYIIGICVAVVIFLILVIWQRFSK